ncbi:hypothetical protein [Marinitenerispora sediminis]|uniref:Ribosomal subunit interface protein n=1 Tax=Marinitenerispora sediminis TaxID=1931232 RepID=A0A368T1U0_9ACTN|nr:hypothetical protein [Marinitenerispora sediminis]RCV48744.1 hypothetical protein DEF28_22735 [Marinitenerispora sediminis]RCV48754.1 hypothetical protein DEF23_24570 [Marinitenerispora sediminis]RCV54189.1 hypothetical protein DEF24_19605 [Marinitenerispora sediminis]
MKSRQLVRYRRIAVRACDGFDPVAIAHVRDRFATLQRYSRVRVDHVDVALWRRAVDGYGSLVEAEAVVRLGAATATASAEADSVCAAVDKLRERLAWDLAAGRTARRGWFGFRRPGPGDLTAADDDTRQTPAG